MVIHLHWFLIPTVLGVFGVIAYLVDAIRVHRKRTEGWPGWYSRKWPVVGFILLVVLWAIAGYITAGKFL